MKSLTAIAVGVVALALYHATLLPGFDFGDTGSFQATVGSPLLTPRDAYPLYFAIGGAFVRLTHLEPAYALNLLSAIEGAAASGLLVLAGAELSGSIGAGAAGALLFATSYTFWSQAVIAEVYALHAVFIASTLLLLFHWSRRPTPGRLAAFFAVYALGFGNHLSMVLLLPGFAAFLLVSAPGGWRSVLAPRIVALAIVCAVAGALQYAWNIRELWFTPHPPASAWEAARAFWFDVTKTDWRDTMVMQVPESMLTDRLAMYWFDLRQQFGIAGPVLAAIGAATLARRDWRRALLLVLLYAVNVAFAFSYNVGDTHVFYLPSHLFVALAVACALGSLMVPVARPLGAAAIVAVLLSVATRAYDDFPALDRSADRRPAEVLEHLTAGLDDRTAVLLTDLNWQVANGLSYYTEVVRPEVVTARMPDVILYAPALIADNAAIGRRVFATDRASRELRDAYGPLVRTTADMSTATPLASEIAWLPPGTRYVLCVLRPSRDLPLDRDELTAALRALAGAEITLPTDDYAVVAGRVGEAPALVAGGSRPFRRRASIGGTNVEIRMESWLATDTIRRMGFGHVVVDRQHTLIVERGVSFAAFDERGRRIRSAYRSNIFAPQPRYLCYR